MVFDSPLQNIGAVTIPEPCFQAIIDNVDASKLQQLAKEQSDKNFRLILSLLNGQHDLDSVIHSYYEKFGKYSGWYSFKSNIISRSYDGDLYQLTFHHIRGINWSKYLASYNHAILDKLCEKVDTGLMTR